MYEIIGIYHGTKEVIDSAETRSEAKSLLAEYRLAFGPEWALSIRRARE